VVDDDNCSVAHTWESTPAFGVAPINVAFASPVRPACEAMTNAPIGVVRLPLEITVPLALVNVIDPIEFGSGSHPGVTAADADRPIPRTPKMIGRITNGASMAAVVTKRVVRPPDGSPRSARRLTIRALSTTRFTSHPRKHGRHDRLATSMSFGQATKQAAPKTRTPDARQVNERSSVASGGALTLAGGPSADVVPYDDRVVGWPSSVGRGVDRSPAPVQRVVGIRAKARTRSRGRRCQ
jgi:hypothetical protein